MQLGPGAQRHHVLDHQLAPLVHGDPADERAVELYDFGVEVEDARQVRVARAVVVNDQVHAGARAQLFEHVHAQIVVGEGSGLRDAVVHGLEAIAARAALVGKISEDIADANIDVFIPGEDGGES